MNEINEYKDFIDIDLTKSVIDNKLYKELKWLPFIGKKYLQSPEKILIVGKSHYDDGKNPKWTESLKQDNANIVASVWNGFAFNIWSNEQTGDIKGRKFYRSLERIFFNTKNIYSESFKEKREKLWSSIAFHQLIQNPMLNTWEHKDTKKTRIEGCEKLISLIDVLKPDHVIMMSNDYKYQRAFEIALKNNHNENRTIYGASKGSDIRTIFFDTNNNFDFTSLVHPSSSKSNFTEQNNLLNKIMPKFLDHIQKGL